MLQFDIRVTVHEKFWGDKPDTRDFNYDKKLQDNILGQILEGLENDAYYTENHVFGVTISDIKVVK